MGNFCISRPTNINQINVATLNFSGIALSPFQYYDDTAQLVQINNIYKKIFANYITQKDFQWQVGQIDLKLQKQRYSPVYRDDICVIDGCLVNREEFEKMWDIDFQKSKNIIKKPITEKHIKSSKLFDWIVYQTIINYVYNKNILVSEIKEHQYSFVDFKQIKTYDPAEFIKFLKVWHSKPYLDVDDKIKKVRNYVQRNNLDVVFMQEAVLPSHKKWENLMSEDYKVKYEGDGQSIIIYKAKKFPITQQNSEFQNKYKNKLNFNSDTVFLKTDQFLLVSAHLSSKKQKNSGQILEMFQVLKQLRISDPGLKIIIGVDANSKIQKKLIQDTQFHYYTQGEQNVITSIKKRTDMQLQTKKANIIANKTQDYILSNKEIKSIKVTQIDGNDNGHKYLPNEDHPYDHFLVTAIIDNT